MSTEAPNPREYDMAKVAALEFTPECMKADCDLRGSWGVQCIICGDVALLLCLPHSVRFLRVTRVMRCPCGAKAKPGSLYHVISLAGWV